MKLWGLWDNCVLHLNRGIKPWIPRDDCLHHMNTVMELWGLQKASNWCPRSSAMFWGVGYTFVTDVSSQNIGSDMFDRNVDKQMPIYNPQHPRRTNALTTKQRKSQISHETRNRRILSKWTTISCPRRIKLYVVKTYPTAFPYGNGIVLHFYQQQESSTTKTVHKVINKGLKAYV